jgi:hypothetical protein
MLAKHRWLTVVGGVTMAVAIALGALYVSMALHYTYMPKLTLSVDEELGSITWR